VGLRRVVFNKMAIEAVACEEIDQQEWDSDSYSVCGAEAECPPGCHRQQVQDGRRRGGQLVLLGEECQYEEGNSEPQDVAARVSVYQVGPRKTEQHRERIRASCSCPIGYGKEGQKGAGGYQARDRFAGTPTHPMMNEKCQC